MARLVVTVVVTVALGGAAEGGEPAAWPSSPCAGHAVTRAGTPGADVIVGTSGADVIHAHGGRDVVRGRGGNDLLCAGAGRDKVYGGPGRDRARGGSGTDFVDVTDGRGANDRANGGRGRGDGCAIDVRDFYSRSCEAVIA
jgi:Ca2+-binding RTX toxin-like protein